MRQLIFLLFIIHIINYRLYIKTCEMLKSFSLKQSYFLVKVRETFLILYCFLFVKRSYFVYTIEIFISILSYFIYTCLRYIWNYLFILRGHVLKLISLFMNKCNNIVNFVHFMDTLGLMSIALTLAQSTRFPASDITCDIPQRMH